MKRLGQTHLLWVGLELRSNVEAVTKQIISSFDNILNIARCIVSYICLMAGKLESHCTLKISNE